MHTNCTSGVFVASPDLLGLLTVYGQEFENAIVAEDGESAMGDWGCCNDLRRLSTMDSRIALPDFHKRHVAAQSGMPGPHSSTFPFGEDAESALDLGTCSCPRIQVPWGS